MKNLNRTETVGKMTFEENKTAAEISEVLGITVGSVYTYQTQYRKSPKTLEGNIIKRHERAAEMFLDKGMTKKEISGEMGLSITTINKYINKYKRENGLAKEKNNDEVDIEEIKKEWDVARFRLNPNARRES